MGVRRKAAVAAVGLLVVVGLVAAAFATGVLGAPSAGLIDHGDWGTVTENETEVVTTVWVDNPNPFGITLGNSVGVEYQLYLNGVGLAEGEKRGVDIPAGNTTVDISTYVRNDAIAPWWVAFVEDNETVHLRAESTADIDDGTVVADLPTQNRTMLANSTPVIDALSQSAAEAEGNYTRTVDTGLSEETLGYEVRRGWASWGRVTDGTTTVNFHYRIHNPSSVAPVPAVPEGLGMRIGMNNVTLFEAQGDRFDATETERSAVIPPNETQSVTFTVRMNNSNVDDWFRSHVRNDERTTVETRVQLVFEAGGETFRLPRLDGPGYTCEFQTAIMVDDQSTTTDCAQPDSVPP
jgi:LEA14-like dessication related protein